MTQDRLPRVLIVGAGAMGIVVGHFLSQARVQVSCLVRPHRAEALNRPQVLYCYNDNQLKTFKEYTYLTEPAEIINANFDYILITLDAVALMNEVGQNLAKTIGKAVRGTSTKVLLGTVFYDLKPWFLQTSGLSTEQVTNALLFVHAYATKAVTLPVHAPTDQSLLDKADFAYIDSLGPGFVVDDSSPVVAKGFAELYNGCGVSTCNIMPAAQLSVSTLPIFAVFAACQLLDWPKFQDIGSKGETWSLAVAAVKEIQGLRICGELGQQAAEATSEAGFAASLAGMEKVMLPLDLQEFYRYHHGGKVNGQDRELLEACLTHGEAEGKPMSALRELVQRVEQY
ncbi:hypothetical protein PV11_02793 [Exophiala sideris]|uniref:Ketopantoate reductase N-terminal domain-containing protein n=1 Tax=Exophiala sideris TaxID=1016849 RepID=A0A0D1WEI5_9EURO|nr:hypothetical protein PV11_02793 [Exophiala sideris]